MSISDPTRPRLQPAKPPRKSNSSNGKQQFTRNAPKHNETTEAAARSTPTTSTTSTEIHAPPTMSRSNTGSTLTSKHPKQTSTTSNNTTTTANEVKKLNAIYASISAVIPDRPYLLSVPVNVEPRYHYPSRQEAESWQRNTPFYPHEEGLQYMSFVLRDPADSCYRVQSALDEEREREIERKERKLCAQSQGQDQRNGNTLSGSADTTRPSTPVATGKAIAGGGTGIKAGVTASTKRKISLSAYKSKKEGKEVGTTSQLTPKKETAAPVMDKAERQVEKQVNGMAKGEAKAAAADSGAAATKMKKKLEALAPGVKRHRDSDLDKAGTAAGDRAPSIKKLRTTPPPPPSHKPARQRSPRPSLQPSAIEDPNGAPYGLPALLSPTNPFESAPPTTDEPSTLEKKNANKWDLPDMLSPTLPPKIEAELAREKERGGPISATSSPASKATRMPGSSAQSPELKAQPLVKLQDLAMVKARYGTKELAKAVDSEEDDEEDAPAPVKTRTRQVVRLKYSKKAAYKIKSLLRIPPRPDRVKYPIDDDVLLAVPARQKERPPSKPVAELSGNTKSRSRASSDATSSPLQCPKKDGSGRDDKKDRLHPANAKASSKMPEKRPRYVDAEPAPCAKKQKAPSSFDLDKEKKPKTPITSAIPSPALQKSGGSLKDTIAVTPRSNHLKAAAMARSASADSPVATPNDKINSHGTPLPSSSSRLTSRGPTSAPVSGPRKAQAESLLELSAKYNKLGRDLKHENQDINKKTGERTVPELKRMALLGMECIMSYMLAYSLADSARDIQNKPAEIDSSWVSLLPLFKHMRHFMRRYEPLLGLHNYLGITINARIASVAGDRSLRLSHLPWPADSPQSGNNGSSNTSSQPPQGGPTHPSAPEIQRYFDAVSSMTECNRAAASTFPAELIQEKFPDTWGKRDTTGRRGPSSESLIDEKGSGEACLKGRYWVPVGVDSAPVQAARFGVQILREWIREEELGYEPRIRI